MDEEVKELMEKVMRATGKSEKEIRKLMEEKKEATHGLLSDYGAIYAVAKELNVPIYEERNLLSKIKELEVGRPANVIGRVKVIYPVNEFKRDYKSVGKVSGVILADETGDIRLVLWDNHADIVNNLKVGDVLLVRNGYCKEGLKGKLELHAGFLTGITINPRIGIKPPEFKEELVKINQLSKDMENVNLICRVNSYFPPREFTKPSGEVGLRASFIAEDETGMIRVVLWDQASQLQLKRGDIVKIENGYVREGINQELELHVGKLGRVYKTDEKLDLEPLPDLEKLRVCDVKPDMTSINICGRVLQVYSQRVCSTGTVSSFLLGDETGMIRVVLWDQASQLQLKRGDIVKIENGYSKANLDNEPEIHVGKYGKITVENDIEMPSLEEIESSILKEKKISELELRDRYVKLRGKIVDIDDSKRLIYMTCPNCGRRVFNIGVGWFCESCNEEVDPEPSLMVSLTLEDDTGSIRVVAFKENAEKILDMTAEDVMDLISETGDELAPILRAKEMLLNQELVVTGRTRYSEFSDRLEFIVDGVE
ncbi:MAG: hypothetical protein DRO65_04520 [Candidatus Altiarchaeales archaeon]|nr:MAG: hypothetical protein DRO65_04520 [Candidatus Altiarchaeales archaeon]